MSSRVPQNSGGKVTLSTSRRQVGASCLPPVRSLRASPGWHWRRCAKRTGFRSMHMPAGWREVSTRLRTSRRDSSHICWRRTPLQRPTPDRGRFRAFLLTAMKNFVANERDKVRAEKRGGGQAVLSLDFDSGESRCQIEPSHELTPEELFERRWVLTLLDQVLDSLRMELAETGKEAQFDKSQGCVARRNDSAPITSRRQRHWVLPRRRPIRRRTDCGSGIANCFGWKSPERSPTMRRWMTKSAGCWKC